MLLPPHLPTTILAALLAQAEPAPLADPTAPAMAPAPSAAAPATADGPSLTPNGFGLAGGMGARLGGGADDVPPSLGYALHPFFTHRYASVAGRFELGLELGFSFDRYQREVTVDAGAGATRRTADASRSISYYDFTLLQTAALRLGPVRPWLGVGGGVVLGYFQTVEPEFAPGELRAMRPVLKGAGGFDVSIAERTSIGVRANYVWMARKPGLTTTSGDELAPLGDRFAMLIALTFGF